MTVSIAAAIQRARNEAEACKGTWMSQTEWESADPTVRLHIPQGRTRQLALLDVAQAVANERSARRSFMASSSKKRALMIAWQEAGTATDLALRAFAELVDGHDDSGGITEDHPERCPKCSHHWHQKPCLEGYDNGVSQYSRCMCSTSEKFRG